MDHHEVPAGDKPTVYVLSDSLGETAELVARAAIAQYPPESFYLIRLPKVSSAAQLADVVRAACRADCVFFYTLANPRLREEMCRITGETRANFVDILGPGIDVLSGATGVAPTGEIGALRRTDSEYFERIEALEFAVAHDDGRGVEELDEAEVVLIGVSRTSKTPLSMYLAFKGYKVANIPLAAGMEPPSQLFEVDPRRVFGLTADPELLAEIRAQRFGDLGTFARRYADREAVEREVAEARALMKRIGCVVINTGNKAVEETANEIVRYLGS